MNLGQDIQESKHEYNLIKNNYLVLLEGVTIISARIVTKAIAPESYPWPSLQVNLQKTTANHIL